MKKILTWVLVLAMVLSLAACGSKPEAPAADNNDAPAQDAPAAPVVEETEPPKTRITVEEGYTMVNFEKGTEGIAFWDLTSFGFVAPDVTLVTAEDAYNGQGMRMEIGGVALGALPCGKFRELTPAEVALLYGETHDD